MWLPSNEIWSKAASIPSIFIALFFLFLHSFTLLPFRSKAHDFIRLTDGHKKKGGKKLIKLLKIGKSSKSSPEYVSTKELRFDASANGPSSSGIGGETHSVIRQWNETNLISQVLILKQTERKRVALDRPSFPFSLFYSCSFFLQKSVLLWLFPIFHSLPKKDITHHHHQIRNAKIVGIPNVIFYSDADLRIFSTLWSNRSQSYQRNLIAFFLFCFVVAVLAVEAIL